MTKRDDLYLTGVFPPLTERVQKLLTIMEAEHGCPMFVAGRAVRTADFQHELYLQGRTHPGPIVTNCDGYIKKSDHQALADGFGHAVDIAFLPTKSQRDPWAQTWPWQVFGEEAERLGLSWGGKWKKPADLDHVSF